MAKPSPQSLTVVDSRLLSPHMRRLTLSGPSLAVFPPDQDGAYVKLIFSSVGRAKPRLRTYTVNRVDPQLQQLEIDVVIHAEGGPAARWAASASVGDRIEVAGPGPKKMLDPKADWFLIAGDMTTLPAIRANLACLPLDARGHLVLEVLTEADKLALDLPLEQLPAQLQLHWLINPHPGKNRLFADYLEQLPWLDGAPAIWVAGELVEVLKARTQLKSKPGVEASRRYISSYWQYGMTEDRHKVEKSRLLS
ncbi:MAG: NADPH-dependent ferric siderophore reductase [Motiliproteus sp.]|jgi:NADPH-dependent ferric siderophore reductase